jgi:hypothetical protein
MKKAMSSFADSRMSVSRLSCFENLKYYSKRRKITSVFRAATKMYCESKTARSVNSGSLLS